MRSAATEQMSARDSASFPNLFREKRCYAKFQTKICRARQAKASKQWSANFRYDDPNQNRSRN